MAEDEQRKSSPVELLGLVWSGKVKVRKWPQVKSHVMVTYVVVCPALGSELSGSF